MTTFRTAADLEQAHPGLLARLGTVPDSVLAAELGCGTRRITCLREKFRPGVTAPRAQGAPLGARATIYIGSDETLQRYMAAAKAERISLSSWLCGLADRELDRRDGVTPATVVARRPCEDPCEIDGGGDPLPCSEVMDTTHTMCATCRDVVAERQSLDRPEPRAAGGLGARS